MKSGTQYNSITTGSARGMGGNFTPRLLNGAVDWAEPRNDHAPTLVESVAISPPARYRFILRPRAPCDYRHAWHYSPAGGDRRRLAPSGGASDG